MGISKAAKSVYDKQYRLKNLSKRKAQQRDWYRANKEKKRAYDLKYRAENRGLINSKVTARKRSDPQFRLQVQLRSRILRATKAGSKSGSAVRDLGCSIDFFRSYIESMFKPGMTWDNWTLDGWHLDHVQPLSSFDLTDREQFLKAVHYTNLQPLWAHENLSKSNKVA